ncbi:MAG: SDR family oxidoreductase [Patulibacter sp.]
MGEVVVTGASGLLGGAVLRTLRKRAIDATGWSRHVACTADGLPLHTVDITRPQAAHAIEQTAPRLVVHCAALTDVDACERDPDAAWALNAAAPGRLAAAAAACGARFIHISTDAVYDGQAAAAHAETETPAPANAYARSKLAGEELVLTTYPAATVVRTTMHGWTAQGRRSFSESILRTLLAGQEARLFTDVTFSALDVETLADLLLDVAATDAPGILNVGAADAVTKEAFGRQLATAFAVNSTLISSIRLADLDLPAPRPRNCAMSVDRLASLLRSSPPTVADGITRLHAAWRSGSVARMKGLPDDVQLAEVVR